MLLENSLLYGLQRKKGYLMLLTNQFKAFITNLNARHVNGMTHFHLAIKWKIGKNTYTVISYL